MEQRIPIGLAHHIRSLAGLARAGSLPDADLLAAFVERGDGDSFTALVVRHGQAVWNTCRQVLDSDADAEDAFQATFIVLARHAASLRRESLAGWLRKVARRLALDAYKAAKRRSNAHRRLCEQATSRTSNPPLAEDVWMAVRDELASLPEKLRVPLTLFYLDGRTQAEAAEWLGIAERTLRERLVRGLAELRERLSHRGMVVATAALVAVLGNVPALSAMPISLVESTTACALAIAHGETVASPAAILADQVARSSFWSQSKKLLAILTLALGVGIGGWQALASSEEASPRVNAPSLPATLTPIAAPVPKGPVVSGVVNDADGKPIANADVAVFLSSPPGDSNPTGADKVVGVGRADKDGAFQIVLPDKTPTKPLLVLAGAAKKAVNAVEVDADKLTEVRVSLADAEPISGNVIDSRKEQPIAGARVRVWHVGPIWIAPSLDTEKDPAPPVPFWPTATTTNAKGEFTLTGLARTTSARVEVAHPDYGREDVPPLGKAAKFKLLFRTPKVVTGKVVAGNPAMPVADATVGYKLRPSRNEGMPGPLVIQPVGQDGIFKLSIPPTDYAFLSAAPPVGSPFRAVLQQVDLEGRDKVDVELVLPAVKR